MIIFLHGSDTFRSREKLKTLHKKFVTEIDASGLNVVTHDAKKSELQNIRQEIFVAPFLAKKRMVIIENALQNYTTAPTQKPIIELLKEVEKKDIIIILFEEDVPKKLQSTKLYKWLSAQKFSYQFLPLAHAPLKQEYQKIIQNQNAPFDNNAFDLLMATCGDDLWHAKSEIQKLTAYCAGKKITTEDVVKLSKGKLEGADFELTDALGQKNSKRALKLIHDQLQSGVTVLEIINKVSWHIKNIIMTKSLVTESANNLSSWQVAQTLKFHPFAAKKILAQSRNFDLLEIKNLYQKLINIEIAIKTNQADPSVLLDLFVASNSQ